MATNWIELDQPKLTLEQGLAFILDDGKLRGLTADEMLRGTPLFYDELLKGRLVSPEQLRTVITHSLKLAQPDAPFSIGRQVLPGSDPILSRLILQAPTLGESLKLFLEFQHHWLPLVDIIQVTNESLTKFCFKDRFQMFGEQNGSLWHWVICYSVMAIVSFYQWRFETRLPWTLNLPGSPPKHAIAYRQNLGFAPHFNKTVSSLGITTDILRLKMPNQSNSLFRSAELKKPTETEVEYSLPSFIRKLLNSRLQDPPSLSEAANLCDISPATLKRKLKKHRTSYQKLIDECRLFKAVELMENQSYTRTDLAQYFCIQDSSNFQRSWKRWISQVN